MWKTSSFVEEGAQRVFQQTSVHFHDFEGMLNLSDPERSHRRIPPPQLETLETLETKQCNYMHLFPRSL